MRPYTDRKFRPLRAVIQDDSDRARIWPAPEPFSEEDPRNSSEPEDAGTARIFAIQVILIAAMVILAGSFIFAALRH